MKKIFYLLVISFLFVFSLLVKAGDYWSSFQYPAEAKNYIYSAKMSGDRLFLGTNGHGLFYTDNLGVDWTKLENADFNFVGIYDILFGPAGEIYCITNNQIYKTGDFGKNWNYFNYFYDNGQLIKSAFINPQGTIVVGSDKGVYVSDSSLGGTQWTSLQTGHKDFITDKVIIDPSNNIFVAGWADGSYSIFLTDISGSSFGVATDGIGCGIDSAHFATDQSGNVFLALKACIYKFNIAKHSWEELGQTLDDNAKQIRLSPTGLIALFNPNDLFLFDPKTKVVVRNPGINDTTKKYLVDVLIRPGGQIIVMDPEEANGSVVTIDVIIIDYTTTKFRVTDARGTTLNNATFMFYKGECDTNYHALRVVTTNNAGIFELPTNVVGIYPGDKFKLGSVFWQYPCTKPNHDAVEDRLYDVELNNMKFDDRGVPYYQTLTTDSLQQIVVDHQLIGLFLTASIEWDATREYFDSLDYAIRMASRDLYDISDGQLYIKKIAIYDNKRNWDQCDLRVHASTEGRPCANVAGAYSPSLTTKIFTPRRWLASEEATNYNGQQSNWINIPYWQTYGETIAHELGHYFFGFYDEYVWTDPSKARLFPGINFGFMMDSYLWIGNNMGSEMSTALTYTNPNARYTMQWAMWGKDCWSKFKDNYETQHQVGSTPNALFKIYKPSERTLAPGYDYLIGPVDIMTNQAGCDVTRTMFIYLYDADIGAGSVYMYAYSGSIPIVGVTVTLQRNSTTGAAPMIQGKTNREGHIYIIGAKVGDVVLFDGSSCPVSSFRGMRGSYTITSLGASGKTPDKTQGGISIELKPFAGDYGFVNSWRYTTDGSMNINLFTNKSMVKAPVAEIITEKSTYDYDFVYGDKFGAYYATIPDYALSTDLMSYKMYDDNSEELPSSIYYDIFDKAENLVSSDGKTELNIDTLAQKMNKIAIMSSTLQPLLNGLPDSTEHLGPIVSITAYPEELSSQDNILRIQYGADKLEYGDETTLSLYRWDEVNMKWGKITSIVDTAYNYVMANISSSGTYAIFTTLPTGINELEIFKSFGLKVEPNPSSGTSNISFNLPVNGVVNLELFNALGMKLITLCNGRLEAGKHNYELNGEALTSGIYFVRLNNGINSETVKLVLTK